MRIFVTGGSGLAGSHLLDLLSNQYGEEREIIALCRNAEQAEQMPVRPGVTWVPGNLLDPLDVEKLLEEVDQVYHCAAMVEFLPNKVREMMQFNVQGTANLVNACILQKVKKLVFISSVAALGRGASEKNIDEGKRWTPESRSSQYGKSKYLAEMEVWRGMGEGLQVAIVNPSIILGEGDWNKSSCALFKTSFEAFPWYSEGTNGFVDVKDVVKAMWLLMESTIAGEKFILSAENLSYQKVFNAMADAYGKSRPHKKITPFLAGIVWRWEALKYKLTGKKPLVTKETTQTALAEIGYNNQKFLNLFTQFSYTPIDQSIKRICAYYLQRNPASTSPLPK
jgi:dihydroflavonol-4-reductase